jgi:hypothetical protein
MNLNWYLNRLKKMGPAEIFKRVVESGKIHYSKVKYRDSTRWPYSRFVPRDVALLVRELAAPHGDIDFRHYSIYGHDMDVTAPLNWHFSEQPGRSWPVVHYARINYRPGNPYGDVRINWELNRLQFLPALAMNDRQRAVAILADWLAKNPYLHGPAYISSMELAIRWISLYRTFCVLRGELEPAVLHELTGLAVASGHFIANRLSTHSSAGNHLIVEAAGLFWLGKALGDWEQGQRWVALGREILHEQILRQVNPDGSSREQSFWYLGFVLDAINHYLMLEDPGGIPEPVRERITGIVDFIRELAPENGVYPDFGDRDDGFISRPGGSYAVTPFAGLTHFTANFIKLPADDGSARVTDNVLKHPDKRLRLFREGGMTLMQQGRGSLLFRHAPLGLPNTFGHGHADALSVILNWSNTPVLIDVGSGQYNGDQNIRNYFRSTIAHNTIEVNGRDQARHLGPFLWEKSYETVLTAASAEPELTAEASHDGYRHEFGVSHSRKIVWHSERQLRITDSLSGGSGLPFRGAFHLGECQSIICADNLLECDFGSFFFRIRFPEDLAVALFHGCETPFFGWRTQVYGRWTPIHAVQFSGVLTGEHVSTLELEFQDK